MTDDRDATGPETGGAVPGQHPVTAALSSDAVILMLARQTVEDGGNSSAARVDARRVLDGELRALVPWPSGEDYARAAADYERMGRADDAALLRRLAATDMLIDAARDEWNTRYDRRPTTPAGQMIDAMRDAGLIDFDPAGPYLGVDGAAYEPGAITVGDRQEPSLVITGRGTAEFVTDWQSFDAMASWVASRGTTASGPLTPPAGRNDSRVWEEDQVLARLVTSPGDAPRLIAELTPDTFTTDVRYDLYQAVTVVAGRGGYYAPEQVAAEIGRQMASVPPHAFASYGGAAGAFPRAYLARLASTEVGREAAAAAASGLVRDDARYRARPARAMARPRVPAPGADAELHHEQARPRPPLLQQPRPQPGPGGAAAQRP